MFNKDFANFQPVSCKILRNQPEKKKKQPTGFCQLAVKEENR